MRTRALFLVFALMPVPVFAQNTVVTSLPRPADNTTTVQAPPPVAFIPPPDVPDGPPANPVEVYTRPERRFAFALESQLLFPVFHQHLQAPITVPGFYT